jgi:hypothetical protein
MTGQGVHDWRRMIAHMLRAAVRPFPRRRAEATHHFLSREGNILLLEQYGRESVVKLLNCSVTLQETPGLSSD